MSQSTKLTGQLDPELFALDLEKNDKIHIVYILEVTVSRTATQTS